MPKTRKKSEEKVRAVTPGPSSARVALLVGLVVFAGYLALPFRELSERSDRANWDYMAQVIADGGAPYRDAVNIKTPLAAYVSAVPVLASRILGVRDIFAIRVFYLLLTAALVGLVFFLVEATTQRRFRALLAAGITATTWSMPYFAASGTEPKVLCIALGLAAQLAVARRRYLLAGTLLGLAALAWQGALVFVIVFLVAWIHQPGERRRIVGGGLAGLVAPAIVLAAVLALQGALRAAYTWAIAYGLQFYLPQPAGHPGENLQIFKRALGDLCFGRRPTLWLALAGAVIAIFARFRGERPQDPDAAVLRDGMLLVPTGFAVLSTFNIQGIPDTMPFAPYLAWFVAEAIDRALGLIVPGWRPSARRTATARTRWVVTGVVAVVFVVYSFPPALQPRLANTDLTEQLAAAHRLESRLGPGDDLLVFGPSEVLVLLERHNASPYFLLDMWMPQMVDRLEPGGFRGWLARTEPPKLVLMSRMPETLQRGIVLSLRARYRRMKDYWPYWERVGDGAARRR